MKGWMRRIVKIRNTSATGQWRRKRQYLEYSKAREILHNLAMAGFDIWMVENGKKLKMTVTDGEVTTGFVFDLNHQNQNYFMLDEPNQQGRRK